MRFGEDTRGQSVLIGSILLFAILIIAFSSYQAFVVPNQNAEVEFNHNEDVQNDMQDLRNSLLDVRSVERIGDEEYAIVSEHRPTRVRLGTQFPERLIALNPPAPSGTLRTAEASTPVEIQNAEIDETKEDRFPNDVSALFEPHETAFLTYQPSYSEYQSAPNTVLEHSLLYNEHPERDLAVREQNVVNTSRETIDIVLFDGDFSRSSSRAVTLDPQTLDGPTAPVPIVPEDGENIRLRLPVESREAWNESIDRTSGAEIIESSEEEIVIELEGNEYDLRMSKVGFDGGTKDNQFTPIQTTEPEGAGTGGVDPYPGPNVTSIEATPNTGLQQGDEFDLTASITNVGNDDNNRGGTPIQRVEWYIGGDQSTVTEFPDSPTDLTEYSLSVSQPDIEVDNRFETGENDIQIRAQDSRGIWGDEREVTVDVISDEEELQISTRIDDLSTVDTDTVRFLTSFDVSGVDETAFERIRVEGLRQNGNSIGEDSVSTTRGSVELEGGFGVGDEFDISIEVIYTDENGDEFVEETRTETVTANGENTIEDDLSTSDSPSFDNIDIVDESGGNAQFRIDYLVDQPDGFEVDGALVGLEIGTGFDRGQNGDQDGEIELSTYGNDGEFKVAGLLREENTGVVVDAGSEIRTAGDEPAPPFFDVTIDTTNSPITEGETLTVDATITNTGEEEGTQDIELLDFGGTVVDTEADLTLAGGDSTTVQLEWGTEVGDAGTDEITVQSEDDSDSATVTVEEEEYDIEITNLEDSGGGNPNWYNVSWSATVPDGETIDIRLSFDGAQGETVVERTGSHDDTQRLDRDSGNPDAIVIEIISDGTVVASDQVDV